jgi:UDP-N-acetylmuramoyl-tripeptide--D-alanyl-D-alanine ligase
VIVVSIFNIIWKNKSYPEILILEYGIDTPGDMSRLIDIIRPNIGVITAIGKIPSHIEFFANSEAIIREKKKLVNAVPATGFVILNCDDKDVYGMRNNTRAHAITYGFREDAMVRIINMETRVIKEGTTETIFKVEYGGSVVPVRLSGVIGKPQVYSATASIATGLSFGMNLVKIADSLKGYSVPLGRMKILEGLRGSTIIDDTYNSSPSAVEASLDAMRLIRAKRKIAVLGDMLELGVHTIQAHKKVGECVSSCVKILITVGDKAKIIAESAEKTGLSKKNIFIYSEIREAGRNLKQIIEEGDLVLVKGSQSVRMEKIVKEVLAKPEDADVLLVRQSSRWLDTPGMYG